MFLSVSPFTQCMSPISPLSPHSLCHVRSFLRHITVFPQPSPPHAPPPPNPSSRLLFFSTPHLVYPSHLASPSLTFTSSRSSPLLPFSVSFSRSPFILRVPSLTLQPLPHIHLLHASSSAFPRSSNARSFYPFLILLTSSLPSYSHPSPHLPSPSHRHYFSHLRVSLLLTSLCPSLLFPL